MAAGKLISGVDVKTGQEVTIAVEADGSIDVFGKGQEYITPTDIQSRYAQTIQTHNAVSVASATWSNGAWIDASGFDRLSITLLNSAITNSNVDLQWSNDGLSIHGVEAILGVSNGQQRTSATEIKARYFRFCLYNGDATAKTMSAWAYLKA